MPLDPGTRLGAYEIVAPIGAGGMGEVYRARDTKLGRDVAVKVLPESLATPDLLERFEREARAVAALSHPNILAIHDFAKDEALSLRGDGASRRRDTERAIEQGAVAATQSRRRHRSDLRSLRDLLAEGPIPGRKLLELATQIAEGLAKAHAAGIVHRDLKPENLIVTDDGFVKILDFGLAKLMAREPLAGSQLTTAVPEQAKALPVDYRSDQFSLG